MQAWLGAGQPLTESVRSDFEARFGQDFSQVRIHTDGRAAQLAAAVSAKAYTVGRDLVFGKNCFAPDSNSNFENQLVSTCDSSSRPRIMKSIK
jgi:hypothetical protein